RAKPARARQTRTPLTAARAASALTVKSSSRSAVEAICNLHHRTVRRPAGVRHQLPRCLTHSFHAFRVTKKLDPRDTDVFRAFHLNRGPCSYEARRDFCKVL